MTPANPQPPEERDVSVIALRLASDPSLSREDLAAAIASALREERERNSNRAWRIRALEDQARADRYQKALREALADLSDAERALEGWKFKGGMGVNIAQEDRGRFPTLAYRSRRAEAEAMLREGK